MNLYHSRKLMGLVSTVLGLVCSGMLVLAGLTASRADAQGRPAPVYLEAVQVLSEPQRYVGRPLSVEGEVACVFGEGALALRSNLARTGMLVVLQPVSGQGGAPVRPGEWVRVNGSLRLLTRQELHAIESALQGNRYAGVCWALYASYPYVLALIP